MYFPVPVVKTNLNQLAPFLKRELNKRMEPLLSKKYIIELPLPNPFLGAHVNVSFAEDPGPMIQAQIQKIFDDASRIVFPELGEQLKQNMKASSWGWNGGTRDIVDTGELMNSQRITINGTTMALEYDSPYANITHYGGYIYPYGNKSADRVYLPARPWITATIQGGGPVPKFDFYQAYQRAVGL